MAKQYNSLKDGIDSLLETNDNETIKKYKNYSKKVRDNYSKSKSLTDGIDTKDFENTKKKMSNLSKKGC